MSSKIIVKDIEESISNLQSEEKLRDLIHTALSESVPPLEIIEQGLRKGLESVGKKYGDGEYFLSELLFAGVLMNNALEILKPQLKSEDIKKKSSIVLGTVRGDIHDIGKNIFKMLALAEGFEVYDLGVDVEPEKFLEKVKETNPQILGMSSLLTTTRMEMKIVIDQMKQSQLKVPVIIGGNAVTKDFAEEIGADEAALDAVEGIEICKKWFK